MCKTKKKTGLFISNDFRFIFILNVSLIYLFSHTSIYLYSISSYIAENKFCSHMEHSKNIFFKKNWKGTGEQFFE